MLKLDPITYKCITFVLNRTDRIYTYRRKFGHSMGAIKKKHTFTKNEVNQAYKQKNENYIPDTKDY